MKCSDGAGLHDARFERAEHRGRGEVKGERGGDGAAVPRWRMIFNE